MEMELLRRDKDTSSNEDTFCDEGTSSNEDIFCNKKKIEYCIDLHA